MECISALFNITNLPDFRLKYADGSKTQGVGQIIYMYFGSYLGNA